MNQHRDRIAIEFISVLGLPPVEYVRVAADLHCDNIGIALEPIVTLPKAYPHWSLRDDGLRRETIAVLRRLGVSISVGEGFLIWPDKDIRDAAADLDLMAELGAKRINMLSLDPDRGRTLDQCAVLAELAAARGLGSTIEFMPGVLVGDLSTGLAVVKHANNPKFGVLVDAMHFFRSGSDLAQLAATDPALIGYVQLCDVPLKSDIPYGDEARFDRLPPGEGELPLLDFLTALPDDKIVGLEVPMLAKAEAGIGPQERLSGCIAATCDMLDQVAARRASRGAKSPA